MNPKVDAHPEPDQLHAFARGELKPDDATAIERHVAGCDSCCAVLREAPIDSLMGQLHGMNVDDTQLEPAHAVGPPIDPKKVPDELAEHPRYRILKPLGEGGMGIVYKAEHRMMQRTVAIKIISPRFVTNAQAVARFHREVRAAAKLAHPNIVTAHDAEQAGDLHFLAMEYVEGVSLAKLVQKKGPLSVAMACNFVRQAALGLQHAYEQGMVHRDIKPQNLMVTKKGQIKILDFGLARLAQEEDNAKTTAPARALTAVGMVLGTPDYLAPEQAKSSPRIDIRADLYSLGCTFYFLLTGQVPFPTGSGVEKLFQHCEDEPTRIEEVRSKVPSQVADVVRTMMAKSPENRYSTPTEVVTALDGLNKSSGKKPVAVPLVAFDEGDGDLEQRDTPNPPLDTMVVAGSANDEPARQSRFRNPVLWGATALLIGLLVLGAGLWKWNRDGTPPGTPPEKKTYRVVYLLAPKDFWYPDYGPVRDELERADVEVVVASTTLDDAVSLSLGQEPSRTVKPDVLLTNVNPDEYDALIVGGGPGAVEWYTGSGPEAEQAQSLIRQMHRRDKLITAICMGPTVLAEAGLLDGRRVTCFNQVREQIENAGVEVVEEPVVESGDIITAQNDKAAKPFVEAILRALKK